MNLTLDDKMVDGLFSAPHSQGAEEAIPHLHKQEQKRPTPVRRELSRTHAVLGRVIPGGWVPASWMKLRILVALSVYSAFQCAARTLLSDELMSCCAVGTNGCLDLRCCAFALGGAGVQAPWHGVVEHGSIATTLSRLDACGDGKVVHWCNTQTSSHNSQGVVNEADVNAAAPDRSTVLCS